MADPRGFLTHRRQNVPYRPVEQRRRDNDEVSVPLSREDLVTQASRCMDCGVPFCHGAGCPLGNRIPEFNDLIYRSRWREASDLLHATNNFPEITGRICPAPCEAACTLNLGDEPVLIRHIEYQIVERAFAEGWIRPLPPEEQSGKRVAVVGSGPAGLAVAQQLARAGHAVTVFEKDPKPGGLLRYGIPDFKLDKRILDRRLDQMIAEGVTFETNVVVGEDLSARYLRRTFDAICLAKGSGEPRDLVVQGRGLDNVHFAMAFLAQQNRRAAGDLDPAEEEIVATGKHVIVIGGGDTGADCVGTAVRQGAASVTQIEILPEPPVGTNPQTPWPSYPRILRTSSSHEEGCKRLWSVRTTRLAGIQAVRELHGVKVDWTEKDGRRVMTDVPGSAFTLKADLVLLALGFVHVVHSGLVESMGLALDDRGNITVNNYHTSVEGVFATGDASAGASLVVRAIAAGREAAEAIDAWLRERV
ncbi:MAG: glutamate synthase subunit beta [Planctomycetota bacterium]